MFSKCLGKLSQPSWAMRPNSESTIASFTTATAALGFSVSAMQIARDIISQVHYIPVHYHPFYRSNGHFHDCFPVTEQYYEQALSLTANRALRGTYLKSGSDGAKIKSNFNLISLRSTKHTCNIVKASPASLSSNF